MRVNDRINFAMCSSTSTYIRADVFISDVDPTDPGGVYAPIGSLLIQTNGHLWQKFGVGNQDWSTVGGSDADWDISGDDITQHADVGRVIMGTHVAVPDAQLGIWNGGAWSNLVQGYSNAGLQNFQIGDDGRLCFGVGSAFGGSAGLEGMTASRYLLAIFNSAGAQNHAEFFLGHSAADNNAVAFDFDYTAGVGDTDNFFSMHVYGDPSNIGLSVHRYGQVRARATGTHALEIGTDTSAISMVLRTTFGVGGYVCGIEAHNDPISASYMWRIISSDAASERGLLFVTNNDPAFANWDDIVFKPKDAEILRLVGYTSLGVIPGQAIFKFDGTGIGVGDPSAGIDVQSTRVGVLLPRMTTLQRNAINGGVFGEALLLYDSTSHEHDFWDGTRWRNTSIYFQKTGVGDDIEQQLPGGLSWNKPKLKEHAGLVSATQLYHAIDVDVRGNYAYMAISGNGVVGSAQPAAFAVVDISNPASPAIVGLVQDLVAADHLTNALRVKVSGKYAYMVSGNAGWLVVFDISDPNTPWKVGEYQFAATSETTKCGLEVQGNFVYVSYTNSTVYCINVSNPLLPKLESSLVNAGFGQARTMVQYGNYLYIVSANQNQVSVIDASNPANMTIVGTLVNAVFNLAMSAACNGRYLFVGASSGIYVVDMAAPTLPVLVATSLGIGANAYDMKIAGRYLYYAQIFQNRIRIADIGNPQSISAYSETLSGSGAPYYLGAVQSLVVHGRYLYAASYNDNAMAIVDTGGFTSSTANIGSLASDRIDVNGDLSVDRNISVHGGAAFLDGFSSRGNSSVFGSLTVTEPHAGHEALRIETLATNDDPNWITYLVRLETTNTNTYQTIKTLTINQDSSYFIEVKAVARRTGGTAGAAGDMGAYVKRAAVKRIGAAAPTVRGAVQDNFSEEDIGNYDVTVAISGNDVVVQVRGQTNHIITWHVMIHVQHLST